MTDFSDKVFQERARRIEAGGEGLSQSQQWLNAVPRMRELFTAAVDSVERAGVPLTPVVSIRPGGRGVGNLIEIVDYRWPMETVFSLDRDARPYWDTGTTPISYWERNYSSHVLDDNYIDRYVASGLQRSSRVILDNHRPVKSLSLDDDAAAKFGCPPFGVDGDGNPYITDCREQAQGLEEFLVNAVVILLQQNNVG